MDRDAYIKKLEGRIRMQRAQLRWWGEMFERGDLVNRNFRGWPASRVCALLRRLGSPHIVSDGGKVMRRMKLKRRTG